MDNLLRLKNVVTQIEKTDFVTIWNVPIRNVFCSTSILPLVFFDFREVCGSTAGGYFRHFPCMLLMNDCIIYGYLTTGLLFTVTILQYNSILLCTTERMFGSYNHKSFSWIAFNPGHLILLRLLIRFLGRL